MNIERKKDYPKSIFKYCHLKNENYINNLIENEIWLSNPLGFNDPYDCSVTFDNDKINEILIKNNIKNILEDFPEDEISLNDKQIILSSENPKEKMLSIIHSTIQTPVGKQELSNILNIESPKINKKITDNFNKLYKKKLKVSSFSEDNQSLLMWGHYADNHKGFSIEYDIGQMPDDENLKKYLFPIEYTNTIYDITDYYIDNVINKNNTRPNDLIQSVLYKSKSWEYEKEWRFVITNTECSDNVVKVPKPKAIYLGSSINESHRNQLIELGKKNDIPIFQMQVDDKYYKMNIKTIEELEL